MITNDIILLKTNCEHKNIFILTILAK